MGKKHETGERRPASKQMESSPERQQWVAERAYELHAARGYRQGHDLDDWLDAERELDAA